MIQSGIAAVVTAAEPPLGLTARIALVLLAGGGAALIARASLILLAGLQGIPRDLDEAAALDGLGPFATFWHVVLPLARPGLAVTAFYTFLTAWGEVAYAITTGFGAFKEVLVFMIIIPVLLWRSWRMPQSLDEEH